MWSPFQYLSVAIKVQSCLVCRGRGTLAYHRGIRVTCMTCLGRASMAIDMTVTDRDRRLAGEQAILDAKATRDQIIREGQYGA